MAFVRSKVVNGKKYYQLVENRREVGKHRQEVLCHLGKHPSVEAALEDAHQKAKPLEEESARLRNKRDHLRKEITDLLGLPSGYSKATYERYIPTKDDARAKKEELRERYRERYSRADEYYFADLDEEWYLAGQILAYHSTLNKQRKVNKALVRLERKQRQILDSLPWDVRDSLPWDVRSRHLYSPSI